MKLGFSTLGCPGWTLEQIADFAVAQGFDGVELRVHDEGIHLAPAGGVVAARKAADVFASRNVRVFSILGYSRFTSEHPDELARERDTLIALSDMAAALGASFVRIFAGRLPRGVSHEQVIARAAPFLRAACEAAAEQNVTLALETHDDWCSPAALRPMLAGVGPLLGVIWDICNTTMATGLRVTDQYEPLRKALRYCHIKDAVRTEQGDLAYVPIGDGVCALRDALRLLRHDHPEIFLSFEHEKRWIPALPDPASAFAEYLRRMRPMIAEVA